MWPGSSYKMDFLSSREDKQLNSNLNTLCVVSSMSVIEARKAHLTPLRRYKQSGKSSRRR